MDYVSKKDERVHEYITKKLKIYAPIILLKITKKIIYLLKPNYYLGRVQGRAHHVY